MRSNVDALGILYVLWGIWQLVTAVVIGVVFLFLGGGLALVGMGTGGEDGLGIALMGTAYGVIGLLAAVFASVMAIPSLLAGVGLRRRRPWARVLAMVLGALSLLNMPLGTILGVFTLVVLTSKEAGDEFSRESRY